MFFYPPQILYADFEKKDKVGIMIKSFQNILARILPDNLATGLAPVILIAVILACLALLGLYLVKKHKIKKSTFAFYAFISPWLVGFLVYTAYPMVYSFVISFTDWDSVSPMEFVGFKNYIRAFTGGDKWFWQSLKVTFYYTFLSVPLQLVLGFAIALLMNQKIPGMRLFRTFYYLPTLVSGVALTSLWLFIFNYNYGLLNSILKIFGIEPQFWLANTKLVIPSLVLMSLWGVGGNMVIYLAGLQGISTELYEAAAIDGAGGWKKLINITLPQMSSVIFFNLIMGIIGSFQTFTQSYIMTEGGPNGASMFYMLNLYQNAFEKFKMGYASALAWILFVIILAFTALIFKSSDLWVYYETEVQDTKKPKEKKQRRSAKNA